MDQRTQFIADYLRELLNITPVSNRTVENYTEFWTSFRQRAPNLTSIGRFRFGLTILCVSPRRVGKLGVIIKPATLFKFHKALVDRKYRLLFSSSSHRRKPGSKGPSAELIAAVVEMKRRNPKFGCVRVAQQIAYAFGVEIDKDIVRRVLAKHYRPGDSESPGPSWLTFIAQT